MHAVHHDRSTRLLSLMALALAALQCLAALVMIGAPAPTAGEGGPTGALVYAGYFALPLLLVALGLRAHAAPLLGLTGAFALIIAVFHMMPIISAMTTTAEAIGWQQATGLVLAAASTLLLLTIFAVATRLAMHPPVAPSR